MSDLRTLTQEQLLHLVDRAQRGVSLPAEDELLVGGITDLHAALDTAQYQYGQIRERLAEEAADRDAADARVTALETEATRLRTAWTSARTRVKRAKRNRDGELRWAEAMWSDALRDLDRYRTAWKSARHRAAMYLKSNQNFAASLENNHAAYLQLAAASVLPGDKRTCCDARIGHVPGCPANQSPATA